MLLRIVSRGGNFLLGVGPDKTGNFVPEVYQRLEEIGRWMDVHGTGIYNTTPHPPYKDARWAFTQRKSANQVFAFYLPESGKTIPPQLQMPWENTAPPKAIQLLGYKGKLQWKLNQKTLTLQLPADFKTTFPSDTPFCFQLNY
jgi:alpha-L-fucosidase